MSISQRTYPTLGYQYHLRYQQGAQNTNADALSRLPVPTPAMEVPVPAEVVLSLSVVNATPITAARISKWTARDPLLSAVANYVRQGWPSNTAEEFAVFNRRRDELSLQQGCILWGYRVIIPVPGRACLLEELHDCHPALCA